MPRTRIEALLARAPLPFLSDLVERPTTSRSPIRALDGLRGLAVLVVLASHTGGLLLVGHGAAGVWLFFCLSAYLLTLPFAREPERILRRANLRTYAVRRVLRIVPAYYLALGVHLLVLDWSPAVLVEHLLFMRADGILWTIPQEMLFYLLLPLLLLLHPLVLQRRTGLTLVALALIATVSNLALDVDVLSLNGNGRRLPFHLGIFVTGMAFAYAQHWAPLDRLVQRPAVNRALGVLGLVLLVVFAFSSTYFVRRFALLFPVLGAFRPNWPNYYPGSFGVLCGLVVYLAAVCRGRLLQRVLSWLPLRALGLVSFSVYLYHYMVRNEAATHVVRLGGDLLAWTLVVTYLIGAASYTLVERPSMRLGQRVGAAPAPAARRVD